MPIQNKFRLSLLALACSSILFSACSTDRQSGELSSATMDKKNPNVTISTKEAKQSSLKNDLIKAQPVEEADALLEGERLFNQAAPVPQLGTNISTGSHKRLKPTSGYMQPSIYKPTPIQQENREKYLSFDENSIVQVSEKPVSTFSIDVDTAAYSNMRRLLLQGQIPPKDAIKTEELINYFNYQYPAPDSLDTPFSISTELAPSPWDQNKHLLHIGIKGYDMDKKDIPASNLVFLVDVSGSMQSPNKLGLVKQSLKLLLKQLDQDDSVSLVVYAGAAGVVLEPTPASQRHKIERAIDNLTAGGSTNGEAGIMEAYHMAQKGFIKDGINRVIIASDGDMNVGRFKINQLKELIEQKRKSGIALTTLGFGSGNYNYALMEQLADVGNGNAAYIDNLLEAQKVLVNEMSATLLTIAKDVKIQIEFSPSVKEYRLIGYENRMLKREDFNNDKVDAGEIGAGHTVTAIYELSLTGEKSSVDPLRYATPDIPVNTKPAKYSNELAFLKIRYKQPGQNTSQLISQAIKTEQILPSLEHSSARFQFSASVAAFGQQLKGGKFLDNFDYTDTIHLAKQSKGADNHGYRSEFIKLVELAKNLSPKEMLNK